MPASRRLLLSLCGTALVAGCGHVPLLGARPARAADPVAAAPVPAQAPVAETRRDTTPPPVRLQLAPDTAKKPKPTPRTSGPAATGGAAAQPGDSAVAARDLAREVKQVFGEPGSATADSVAAADAARFDIEVRSYETRTRVADYVRIFTGRARGVFVNALQRQTRYGPMMRARLRASGLPEDLTYLALVESWFNPHAYSRAAAVGVWQFMAGTARGMGLRVDWWVDERRDPVRSTEAAARLLRGMKDQFGSLYLAAAAYNGGEGRVSRGLARYADALDGVEGEDRFFALAEKSYLRPETRDYVPKIIAAALVGEEPNKYGVTIDSLPPYAYDSVLVAGGVPLAAVANAAGAPADDVAELNPFILRGMTPPGSAMWVRVPTGKAEGFAERFDALEPAERQALSKITSKKGQSLGSIGSAHGVTARAMSWFNPKVEKLKSGNLRAGQTITVPRADVVRLARDVPNPSIEKYPRYKKKTTAKTATTARGTKSSAKSGAKTATKGGTKSSTKSSTKSGTKGSAKGATKGSTKGGTKSTAKGSAKSGAAGGSHTPNVFKSPSATKATKKQSAP